MLNFEFSHLFSIFVIFITMYVVYKWYTNTSCRLPPGPKGFPLLGNIMKLSHLSLWDHRDLYGDISYMKIGGRHVVSLNSIDVIRKAMLSSNGAFDERPATFVQGYLFNKDVLFSPTTEIHWRKCRQFMMTTLKMYGRGVVSMERIIAKELGVAVDALETTRGKSTDIHNILQSSLSNIIYILLINERFPHGHRMIDLIQRVIDTVNYLLSPFCDSLMMFMPGLRYLPIGPGKFYREHIACKREIMEYLFEKNKNLPTSQINEREGLVYRLIKEMKDSDWLDEEIILGCIDDMMEAGVITTKCSLYINFLILVNYVDVQTNIQREIDNVIGRDRLPIVGDMSNMPYTQAVMLEALRYGTVAPIVLRTCTRDEELSGYVIPKHSVVISNLFRLHHDPNVWPEPWTFDPTRFLDSAGNLLPATHPTRMNTDSFGLGIRSCLGKVFAKTRQFLYITHFLQRFNFRPGDDLPSCDPRDYIADFIIHPRPYNLKIERR